MMWFICKYSDFLTVVPNSVLLCLLRVSAAESEIASPILELNHAAHLLYRGVEAKTIVEFASFDFQLVICFSSKFFVCPLSGSLHSSYLCTSESGITISCKTHTTKPTGMKQQ
jgi:hypothetical protein